MQFTQKMDRKDEVVCVFSKFVIFSFNIFILFIQLFENSKKGLKKYLTIE
jgi:hypothetical protein